MKSLITSFALIGIGVMNMASAQVKLGIKCSPQLTWISEESKSIASGGSRVNLSYGLMIDKYFTDNYAFAVEPGITTMSGKLRPQNASLVNSSSASFHSPEYLYRLQYINVPVLLRMRTGEIGYWRYYAEFGMDFGFLFKARADISSAGWNLSNVNVNDPDPSDSYAIADNSSGRQMNDDIRFMRTGLLFGIGVQYNVFANTLLVAGLRYQNALSDFAKEEAWKASMHTAALHAGVLF